MTLPPEYQISCGIPGRLAVDKSVILLARIISYSLSLSSYLPCVLDSKSILAPNLGMAEKI